MKKYNLIATLVVVSLLILSLLTLFILSQQPKSGDVIATISVDGQTYKEVNLTQVQDEETFVIDNQRGGENTVTIRPGEIAIIHANCHDQICVERGFISDSLVPTVCLPNGVVITLNMINEAPSDALDIITQ